MSSRNKKQNKQHQGAAAGPSRVPQNAPPPADTPPLPAPQILIDRDDGDPPSSRRIAETPPTRNGGPRTAADSGSRSVGTPFALASAPSPAAGGLHPASASPTLVSTPPTGDRRQPPAAFGSSPLTPLSSLQSTARLSGSTGKKSDSSGKSRRSGDASTKKKEDPSKQATGEEVDDSPAVIAARAAKKKQDVEEKGKSVSNTPHNSSPPRSSRTPPVVHDGGSAHASVRGSVTPASRASDRSHAKSKKKHTPKERSHHSRSNLSKAPSEYPATSILKEYAGSGMGSSDRAAHRAEKRRNSNASTPHNVPLPPSRDADVSNEENEILDWNNPAVRLLADDAVERERACLVDAPEAIALREQSDAKRRRIEEQRGDKFAAELTARFAAEDSDAELAVRVQREELEQRAQTLREAQRDLAEEEVSARADAEAARALLKTAEDQCVDFSTRRQKLAAALVTEEERIRALTDALRDVRRAHASLRRSSERGGNLPPYERRPPPVPVPVAIPALQIPPVAINQVAPTLKDRIILQCFREADLKQFSVSCYRDQGIGWDTLGRPVDVGPAPVRSHVSSTGGQPRPEPTPHPAMDAGGASSAPRVRLPLDAGGAPAARCTHEEHRPPKKESSSSLKDRQPKPPKPEEGSNFYMRPGMAPPAGEPNSSSLSSNSSESGTYNTETNYTCSECTDSAVGGSDGDLDKSQRKKRRKKNKRRRQQRNVQTVNRATLVVRAVPVWSVCAEQHILHEGAQTKLNDVVAGVTARTRVVTTPKGPPPDITATPLSRGGGRAVTAPPPRRTLALRAPLVLPRFSDYNARRLRSRFHLNAPIQHSEDREPAQSLGNYCKSACSWRGPPRMGLAGLLQENISNASTIRHFKHTNVVLLENDLRLAWPPSPPQPLVADTIWRLVTY
ncbi:hypothetical protein C8R45DRAFT_947981 [Mycena sanguinolenta]|nr:hypothetical protein C8R45DRAFT_947981 [Mycena sanguinolenta]